MTERGLHIAPTVSRRVASALALGCVFNPLNSSMIAVALISLHRAFGVSVATTMWLVSAFYLAACVAHPVVGRLADRFGARRTYCAGVAVVGIAGLLAWAAPGFGTLVACRVVQAIGASATFPAGMIMLRRLSGDRPPAGTLGFVSAVQVVSSAAGPVLGGMLVTSTGWRGVFIVNVPLAAVALLLALRWLPRDPPLRRPEQRHGIVGLDLPGVGLFTAALAGLVGFLLSGGGPARLPLLGLAVAAGVLFVRWELRASMPFVDVRAALANVALVGVLCQQAIAQAAFYLAYFALPIWLESSRQFSTGQTGLLLLPLAALALAGTPFAARLVGRAGSRPAQLGGAAIILAGMVALLGIDGSAPVLVILVLTGLCGLPSAFNNIGLQTALYQAVPAGGLGSASGLFQTSRYLGAIVASAVVGKIFAAGPDDDGLHQIAMVGMVLAVALLASTLIGPGRRVPATAASGVAEG